MHVQVATSSSEPRTDAPEQDFANSDDLGSMKLTWPRTVTPVSWSASLDGAESNVTVPSSADAIHLGAVPDLLTETQMRSIA